MEEDVWQDRIDNLYKSGLYVDTNKEKDKLRWEEVVDNDGQYEIRRHVGIVNPEKQEYVVLRKDRCQVDISARNSFLSLMDEDGDGFSAIMAKADAVNLLGGTINLMTPEDSGLSYNGMRINGDLVGSRNALTKKYVLVTSATEKNLKELVDLLSGAGLGSVQAVELFGKKDKVGEFLAIFSGVEVLSGIVGIFEPRGAGAPSAPSSI